MSANFCVCSIPNSLNRVKFVISPQKVELIGPKRGCIRASTVESHGSFNLVDRMERAWLISQEILAQIEFHGTNNRGPLLVLPVNQTDTSNANGAVELASSSLVITCYVKCLPETRHVLSVQERVLRVVPIAEERVFAQSGWENLPLTSRSIYVDSWSF
ncbi:hypothetical protein BUALT_Bualt05G0026000 [Buddleja alternifolia]|uniref:Uncharacterized protein n=1 Tax=Buddleja alternifolia TaxID=168488 RepID=A0AAV6XG41_9LAMI|nr:hypothetical protein BUALT_Bualt05G0026000 [Buddleja alternifolia]